MIILDVPLTYLSVISIIRQWSKETKTFDIPIAEWILL